MEPAEDGTWTVTVDKDLLGKFYTFNVRLMINGKEIHRVLTLVLSE